MRFHSKIRQNGINQKIVVFVLTKIPLCLLLITMFLANVFILSKHGQKFSSLEDDQFVSGHDCNRNSNMLPGVSDFNNTQSENKFQRQWPRLKQIMCPNMQPNHNIFLALFELARMELNFANHRIRIKIPVEADNINGWNESLRSDQLEALDAVFFDSYFKFNSGGLGYSYMSRNKTQKSQSQLQKTQQMVYLRVFKAANNQIRENLKRLLGQTNDDPSSKNHYLEDERNFLHRKSKLFSSKIIPPPQLFQQLQNFTRSIQTKNSQIAVNPTCIVTAIRDPVEQFLSAYNEVEDRALRRPLEWSEKQPWKAKYAWTRRENPLLFTRFEPGSKERFEQFVMDLIGGPSSAGIYPDEKQLVHIYSMAGILWGLKRLGECHSNNHLKKEYQAEAIQYPRLSGYLTSLHNIDIEFPKFVMNTCPGFTPELPSFGVTTTHHSQRDKFGTYRAAKSVWKAGGKTARALCAIRALDYACFDEVPVPAVCRDVFSSVRFLQTLERADNDKDGDQLNHFEDCSGVCCKLLQ